MSYNDLTTSNDLQKLADDARKAEELSQGIKGSKLALEAIEVQIKNAQNDLALINFEREKGKKELEKTKSDIKEAQKIEGTKLVDIQTNRQEAEKEFGEFLASVAKEKKDMEELRESNGKESAKLEEAKKTNQSILDDKKKVLEETKKEKDDLESRRTNAEAQINNMKVLESTLINKDNEIKSRAEGAKNVEREQAVKNGELNAWEGTLKQRQAMLEAREAVLEENEQRAKNLVQVATEKETYLIQLIEAARVAGANPKAIKDVDKIAVAVEEKKEEPPKEEKLKGAKKPANKKRA